MENEEKDRILWIDYAKVFACMLVLLGHFFQSMTKAGILPAGALFQWFDRMIYFFHVQLFFVCSGYLYQRFGHVNNFTAWKKNIVKKSVALGIPYFAFSLITWFMKVLFPGTVNQQADGLLKTLFLSPVGQYWYLYALFFIFLLTPTFHRYRTALAALFISLALRLAVVFFTDAIAISAVRFVTMNEIWFITGMLLCYASKKTIKAWIGAALFGAFLLMVTLFPKAQYDEGFISVLMTGLALSGVIIVLKNCSRPNRVLTFLARYTLPTYLMHTIFAAGLRAILIKLGIVHWAVHLPLGIFISVFGPVFAAMLMEKSVYLAFFLNPWKSIHRVKKRRIGS